MSFFSQPLTRHQGKTKMYSQSDPLYSNEFVAETLGDVPEDQVNAYRAYREKKDLELKKQKQVKKVDEQVVEPGPFQNPDGTFRTPVMTRRKRKIFIDSKDRDTVAYPDASDFLISWGRTFQNVVSISLNSLEFPNVMHSISTANNVISWINQEDIDLPTPYPVYSITIPPGSYTFTTLQTQLTNSFKVPFRHNGQPTSNGNSAIHHSFIVTCNSDTDEIDLTSIIAQATGNAPVVTFAGSSTVTLTVPSHGYNTGTYVYVTGVVGVVGGLQASDINGSYNIIVNNSDTFSFNVDATATSTATGGGTLVKCGIGAPYQIQFGTSTNPIADTLGFPVQNSNQKLNQTDPITTVVLKVKTVIPGNPLTQIVSTGHGLITGDVIYLSDFNVTPSIYANPSINGIFKVASVPSPDVFTIAYAVQYVSDISNAWIGTRLFTMNFPSHGFNRIVEIEQLSTGIVQITTLFDHGYSSSSATVPGIRLAETDCTPSIDGYYNIIVTGSDTFTISATITGSGYNGILLANQVFYLYNTVAFGGFQTSQLNNTPFTIRTILNANSFIFVGLLGFSSTKSTTGGGSGICITSLLHGWTSTVTNTPNGVLNKPVKLSGDNYAFMCIPGITNDSISTSGSVKDIFAKLFLSSIPGTVIFNEFDSLPIEFVKPIAILNSLRFTIMTPENVQATFNGLDYSFGMDVTELVHEDQMTNQTSRRIA